MSTPETPTPPTYQPKFNSIEWNELVTPDPAGAMTFYGELFGWTTEKFPVPGMDYSVWKIGDRIFGGVMAPMQPGTPANWLNYVTVKNITETLEKAVSLGATVCLPRQAIGDAGLIAMFADPQGAVVGLHEAPQCQ